MTRSVLVLRALGLGDLLTGLPALRGLRAAYPNAVVTLAAPRWLAPIAHLSGAVDDVVDARPLRPLPALPRPDLAVNLHGRGPRSTRLLLATDPHRLLAFACAEVPETTGMPRWQDDARGEEREVDRWCRLLTEAGVRADPTRLDLPDPGVAIPAGSGGAVVIHPGAGYGSRRWPPERFAAVAAALHRAGLPVVLTGGADDHDRGAEVARGAGLGESAVLAGRTSLLELAALVARARLVVSGDTGAAHLATALGTPSVVLFGPASPRVWGPPSDRPWHRVLWKGPTGDPFSDAPHPGLLAITVEEVLTAAEQLLSRAEIGLPSSA